MKQLLLLAWAVVPLLALPACSSDAKPIEDIVPAKQVALDLTPQGFPIKINVPDSTFGVAEVMENAGGIEVRVGSKFDLMINTAAPEDLDMNQQKALATAAMDGATVTFTVSSDSVLVWNTSFGGMEPMHHFYLLKKIGNDTYYMRDNIQNGENMFKAEEVKRMMEAARSLRARPVTTPAS